MIRAFVSDLLHDRPRGLLGRVAAGPLWVASGLYGIGLRVWEAGYSSGFFRSRTLPHSVISVGNLTVGGTGKTPFVRFLARRLEDRGEKVAILSRGYASLAAGVSDEALELRRSLPGAVVYVGKDRLRQAEEAIAIHSPTVFVLEDGFQHRRIHRDLDICLVDATNPFGNGHLLPRGILRERPSALKRANLLVLTHWEEGMATSALLDRLQQVAPTVPVLYARHRAKACHQVEGNSIPFENLKRERPFVFSGIATPSSLEKTLQALGVQPVSHRVFLDHYRYTPRDLDEIEQEARGEGATSLLTTEKDLVRIQFLRHAFRMPLLVLEVEMELLHDERELDRRLDSLLQR